MAARLPPKNIISVFNPAEFSTLQIADSSVQLPTDIAQQVATVEADTTSISNYLANYALTSATIRLIKNNIACMTSYTSTGQTSTIVTWQRTGGLYIYKLCMPFKTTVAGFSFSFIELQFLENGVATQYANWCQPYYYGTQGIQVNQFEKVSIDVIFSSNVPLGTTKTFAVACRASIANSIQATYNVGTSGLTYGSFEGSNIMEMKIGNGSNL